MSGRPSPSARERAPCEAAHQREQALALGWGPSPGFALRGGRRAEIPCPGRGRRKVWVGVEELVNQPAVEEAQPDLHSALPPEVELRVLLDDNYAAVALRVAPELGDAPI